jgi:hypothetical protein
MTFKADYKGTCALCCSPVYPGDNLIKLSMPCQLVGQNISRNVHHKCWDNFQQAIPERDRQDYKTL